METTVNNKIEITLRDYQKKAIRFLNENEGKLILAMCPSSGKTETIIYYLNEIINLNPNLKVLILPHSTNVLLNNFYERISSRNVCFDYSTDLNSNVNVHVVLPQNHNKITQQYDLIIVDEAHENYLAKTIQKIIKKTNAKKEILLTGTPYQFIKRKDFNIYFVALSDLNSDYIPKLRIDILESDYDWNGNYSSTRELSNFYKFNKESTETSLKRTFDFLLNRNKSNKIGKTLIVCRDIAQSNYVQNYLDTIGFTSEISNSENDKESSKINDFKNNNFDILIVVNRARLGFDDISLINLIDISGTLNPNIIYQMFARLLRGTSDMQKYYIRLTSKNDDVFNSEIATSVALMLTHSNYISKFDGKNFNSQEIVINPDFLQKNAKPTGSNNSSESNKSTKRRLMVDIQGDDYFDVINFFKRVIEEREKNIGIYKFCKVSDVLTELDLRKNITKTKEECIENALNYQSIKDWMTNSFTIHRYAKSKEWYSECIAHMNKLNGVSRTKEECIESARKYNSIKEWKANDKTIQSYAYTKDWYGECTAHMNKLNGVSRTKEECIENARKYNSIKEWKANDKTIHSYASLKDWYSECLEHMINLGGKSRTKEDCIKIALQYKSKIEWRKKDGSSYAYAHTNNWMEECSAHMINLGGKTRTKEECIENARKYNTSKDWLKNDRLTYMYAQRNGWLLECNAHMDKLIKKRTKQECIENARKYNTIKEWRKNDKTIQVYSQSKEWYSECISHMSISITRKKLKYSDEECIENAKKYNTIKDWLKNDLGICSFARKRSDLYKNCIAHMNILRKSRTKEECIENARKYNTINDWVINDNAIYSYAKSRNEWYEECIAHMTILSQSRTKEECIENARKYNTIKEWRKKDSKFYNYAISKEWYSECTEHMNLLAKSRTKEECIENARKYETLTEWSKNDKNIYNYSRTKSWYGECITHMKTKKNKK